MRQITESLVDRNKEKHVATGLTRLFSSVFSSKRKKKKKKRAYVEKSLTLHEKSSRLASGRKKKRKKRTPPQKESQRINVSIVTQKITDEVKLQVQ